MPYEDYLKALHTLAIENPTFEQVKPLCPHLEDISIEDFLRHEANEEFERLIATPPLRVSGAFQVLWLRRFNQDGCFTFYVAPSVGRMEGSHKALPGFDQYIPILFDKKAVMYAQQHWPDKLVEDNWKEFYFELEIDPHKFVSEDNKVFVAFSSNRGWWGDLETDYSVPRSKLVNEAIQEVTADQFVARELRGNRIGLPYTMRDHRTGIGITSPLPERVSDLLISLGYQFKENPVSERKKEAEEFSYRRIS